MAGEDGADGWYVRSRGRVQGPLSWAQLQALRDRGQLARFDQVSRDRQTWAPADGLERLFPRAGAGGAFVADARPKERRPSRGPDPEPVGFVLLNEDDAGPSVGSGSAEPTGWYYAEAGSPRGPVGYSELERLASGRRIGPGTLYWRSGLDQWTTGADLPELNRLWIDEADPDEAADGAPRRAGGPGLEPGPAPAVPLVDPLAPASLALNLFCGLGNLAAIVAGAVALRRIGRSNGTRTGRGLAIAGLAIGIAGAALSALASYWIITGGLP